MKKGIYLASYIALHENHNIVYQDINGKRDIPGDMLDVDLSSYDFIIATPPCNWWSRANWRRNSSLYSLSTKHLLPDILNKLIKLGKPFIVENVRNSKLFDTYGLFSLPCYVFVIGRHTYWTNVLLPLDDFNFGADDIHHLSPNCRQGGEQVHFVIERFLDIVDN